MIAFKSTPSDDDEEEDDDEELSLLMKNVGSMYKKTKFNNRRRWQGKEDKKIICFNCRKPGHIIAECPKIKRKPSISKKPYKKKALKETWDSESESEEEVNTIHVCFCNAPVRRVRGRHCDVHTQVRITLTYIR